MNVMKNQPDIFIGSSAAYEEAEFVLFGAPFDGTVSYRPGARFAPAAMRRESYGIEEYSPYLDRELSEISVFDAGDIELPVGDTAAVVDTIEQFCEKIISDNKKPVMLGGEHLVTLGAIRSAAKTYENLAIVHFDAHTDLRDDYLGVKLSHAAVIKRAAEIIGAGNIYQYGIRSGTKEEFDCGTHLTKFTLDGVEKLPEILGNRPVYVTLDFDVLDPSVFPGTGTPEHGGVSFNALREAIVSLGGLNIIGFDAVELCPPFDPSGISTAAANVLLREMLLSFSNKITVKKPI
ncbi:MAG: agmatinase [Ruminococcus sp.]|jgi:agmatinase|nr:agmatinase [Ruminococcus sp.]